MKFPVYCHRDQLVGFGNIHLARNDDVAVRQFTMLVNDPSGTIMSETPQYFDLYKVGEFDDETGELIPAKTPELIVTGISVKRGVKDEVSD